MSDAEGPLSTLEIDLSASAQNYLSLAKRLKKGADCGAVVKADAYGLGAAEISKALYEQNCRHFFVATFEEGVEVRNSLSRSAGEGWGEGVSPPVQNFDIAPGGTTPSPRPSPAGRERGSIYVLHGPHGAKPEDFTAHGLTPVLNTPEDIARWSNFAKKTGKKQPAILHLDTGMNRLGLNPSDVPRTAPEGIDIRYVMSHLACADEPAHPKNREQLDLFKTLIAQMGIPARLSFANSGGILLGPDYHFDLARPGCGIYGINPHPAAPNPVLNVVTFRARILQVRDVDRGGSVGYGASCAVAPGTKCATISAGYADGLFRSLSGSGTVVIGGEKCRILGRVSMDSVVADVTALKTGPKPGDWAEIIGPHQNVDDIAAQAGTIGYEILTALGKRYKRTYT
jgi:alanine racemase